MNSGKSDPPRLAIWLMRHACPGDHSDALTGDLIERFREGQTYGWLWKQVLIAFAAGVPGAIRRHWPNVCYAIAGIAITRFGGDAPALRLVPGWLHLRALPLPLRQLGGDLSAISLLALAALPVLAVGLLINGALRWSSLLRTGAISLTLIILGYYAQLACPWLFHLLMSKPDHFRRLRLIIPPGNAVAYLLIPESHFSVPVFLWQMVWPFNPGPDPSFCNFLVSAGLGCRASRAGFTRPSLIG